MRLCRACEKAAICVSTGVYRVTGKISNGNIHNKMRGDEAAMMVIGEARARRIARRYRKPAILAVIMLERPRRCMGGAGMVRLRKK